MVHPMIDARNGHPIMKNHDSHLHGGAHSLKETLRPHQIEKKKKSWWAHLIIQIWRQPMMRKPIGEAHNVFHGWMGFTIIVGPNYMFMR